MKAEKYTVELLNKDGRAIVTRGWSHQATMGFDNPLSYAAALRDTYSHASAFRITEVVPNPTQVAYGVYKDTLAGYSGQRVRPDWDNLKPETQRAFAAAFAAYVREGGK